MSEIREYLSQFDAAAPRAMAEMLRNPSPEQEQGLRIYLGSERYRRMRGLALRLFSQHRSRTIGKVVLIPDFMGTALSRIDWEGKETIMPTRTINLAAHLDRFVARQVASGRYSNASEIVREALRHLEGQQQERNAQLEVLRQAANAGFDEIDQGKGIVLNGRNGIDRFVAEIANEVRTKAKKNGA